MHLIDFDKIYIIILRERQLEFAARCIQHLAQNKFDISKVEFIDAVRGTAYEGRFAAPVTVYADWQIDSSNTWWNRPVSAGEIGCSLSHLIAWQRIRSAKVGHALILEEDFKITSRIPQDFRIELDYDLLYLGRNKVHAYQEEERVDDQLVRPGYSYCTHAYALSLAGASKLLDAGFHKQLIPVDEYLNLFFITQHPRQELYGLYQFPTEFQAYALRYDLIRQTSNGDIDRLFQTTP
ncbi:glycosyltransferase family 25 protein [Streptomyces kronopolitis]|uniref:glycosyltransferase family 25 protein n=1 Tax=Streptomyces kronopolitis TaxID=1612435 RepID=UPI0036BCA13E